MREACFQISTLGLKDNILAALFLLFVELLFGTGSHDNFFGSLNSFYTLDSTDKYISDSLINLMEIFEHSHLFIFVFGKHFLDILKTPHQQFRGVVLPKPYFFMDLEMI